MIYVSLGPVIPKECQPYHLEGNNPSFSELVEKFSDNTRLTSLDKFGPDAILYESDRKEKVTRLNIF